MKIYRSLDFASMQKRIEPNEAGDYLVHLEDYESLNDLIRRSIRTKTKFVPERSENAVYDDDLVEDNTPTDENRTDVDVLAPDDGSADVKRSEDKADLMASGDDVASPLP